MSFTVLSEASGMECTLPESSDLENPYTVGVCDTSTQKNPTISRLPPKSGFGRNFERWRDIEGIRKDTTAIYIDAEHVTSINQYQYCNSHSYHWRVI